MKNTKRKQVVNIDTLSLKAKYDLSAFTKDTNNIITLSDKIKVDLTPHPKDKMHNYCKVGRIYFNNQLYAKIGYLGYANRYQYEGTIQVELIKNTLYTYNWWTFVNHLLEHIPNLTLSQVDIAYDMEISNSKQLNPLEKLQLIKINKCYIKKKWGNNISEYGGSLYIGNNKQSLKRMRIYDKTEELKVNPNIHISNFYSLNGLDTSKQIIRQELILKGKKNLSTIEISKLTDSNYLRTILQEHCNRFYEFYNVVKGKWVTVNFIHHPSLRNKVSFNKYPNEIRTRESIRVYNQKRSLKIDFNKLMYAYAKGNQSNVINHSNSINDTLASSPELSNHVEKNLPYWKKDLISDYFEQYPKEVTYDFFIDITYYNIVNDCIMSFERLNEYSAGIERDNRLRSV